MVTRIAIYGCGAIGTTLAQAVEEKGFGRIVAVYDKLPTASKRLVASLKEQRPIIANSIEDLLTIDANIVIEAAGPTAARKNVIKFLEYSDVLIMDTGILFDKFFEIKETTEKYNHNAYFPSGAVVGVDGLKAMKEDGLEYVELISSKNPRSLEQTKYLTDKGILIDELRWSTTIFEGKASEAVKHFPHNINVAATLSYAAGMDIDVKIIADPNTDRNSHHITYGGKAGDYTIICRGLPSSAIENPTFPVNPKTSYLAALSAIATLHSMIYSVKIGG